MPQAAPHSALTFAALARQTPPGQPLQRAGEQSLVVGVVEPATDARRMRQRQQQDPVALERLTHHIFEALWPKKRGDGHAADRQNHLRAYQFQLAQQVGTAER